MEAALKTLLLMRHAKSDWDDRSLADHDRPLAPRGERDAPRMGQLIQAEGLIPDVILCSTAARTRQTAAGLFTVWGDFADIKYQRELYHGDLLDYREALQSLPASVQRAMLIGHNPTSEYLVQALTSQNERMPTAALAYIELGIDSWADLSDDGSGILRKLWRPRAL